MKTTTVYVQIKGPGLYSGPDSIILHIFCLIPGLVSNIKSVVYSIASLWAWRRMTASQDLHTPSSALKESVVRGHYVYKVIWTSVIGELLPLRAEDNNEHNDHAVAVVKGGNVVGHVSWSIKRSSMLIPANLANIWDPSTIKELASLPLATFRAWLLYRHI